MTTLATLRHRLTRIAQALRSPDIAALVAGGQPAEYAERERANNAIAKLVDEINDVIRNQIPDVERAGSRERRSPGRDAVKRDALVLAKQVAFARKSNDSPNIMAIGKEMLEQLEKMQKAHEAGPRFEVHQVLTGAEIHGVASHPTLPGDPIAPFMAALLLLVAYLKHLNDKNDGSST